METYEAPEFVNYYHCSECDHRWADIWRGQPDDDCPKCGRRHIPPYKSEDVNYEENRDVPRIVLCMEGGLIHEVLADSECKILLIDHDTEGADPRSVMDVPQTSGGTVEAYVVPLDVNQEEIGRLESLYELMEVTDHGS